MTETDPRTRDQYTLTFTSNKLLLAISSLLMLMVLSVMLGIRIERFQQKQTSVLEARAGMLDAMTVAPESVPAQEAAIATGTPARPLPAPVVAPSRPAVTPRATRKPRAAAKATPQPAKTPALTAEDLSDAVPPPTPILLAQAAAGAPMTVQPKADRAPARATSAAAPAGTAATGRSEKFVVQVVSSRDRAQADLRARLLAGQGIPAFVESADLGTKGVWHRVLAGTFSSKTEAKAALAKLQTDPQFASSFVRTY